MKKPCTCDNRDEYRNEATNFTFRTENKDMSTKTEYGKTDRRVGILEN